MTDDDLIRLRGAMTELAEHGGSTDLYERTLSTSRRLRRRSALAASGGAAAAILAVFGAAVALTGGARAPSPAPATEPTATVASPAPSPTPAEPTPSSPTPSAASPSSEPPSTPAGKPAQPAGKKRPADGCPVTAAALDRAARLPGDYRITSDYRITADTVGCWKGWAWGRDRFHESDGVYLFRYEPARGWRLHSAGSAIRCEPLGIPKDPANPPPFCTYDN